MDVWVRFVFVIVDDCIGWLGLFRLMSVVLVVLYVGLLLVIYCFGLCGVAVLCFIKIAVFCGGLFCFRRLRFGWFRVAWCWFCLRAFWFWFGVFGA